jgi:hypothetical protein
VRPKEPNYSPRGGGPSLRAPSVWLQHQPKGNCASRKLIASGSSPCCLHGRYQKTSCATPEQTPGERSTIRPQDRTRVAIVTIVLIRKRNALWIGHDPFNNPHRICRGPAGPLDAGHASREKAHSQLHPGTSAHLCPMVFVSHPFDSFRVRVCITSPSSFGFSVFRFKNSKRQILSKQRRAF